MSEASTNKEDGRLPAPSDDEVSDDEIDTMYVLVELPKGTRSALTMDQLTDLNSVGPTLTTSNQTITGRVEEPLGTHFVFSSKRERPDESTPPNSSETSVRLNFHSQIDKIISFD